MRISIFIPTFNSSRLIRQTLDSILSQEFTDFEVLCVDDGSTDTTPDILYEYHRKDSRIKVFRKENQGSVPFSWNFIFPHLKGDFTLYMSHDDIIGDHGLSLLARDIMRDSTIDCIIPQVVFFENNLSYSESKYDKINQRYANFVGREMSGCDAFFLMIDYTIPGFGLWRTNLIKKFGVPTTSFNSDEYAQRLWAKHCRKIYFSKAKFGYRQTPLSIVRGLKPNHIYSLDTNLRLFQEILDTKSISHPKISQVQYRFFQALVYLTVYFHRNREQYSIREQESIRNIIHASYINYSQSLSTPSSFKGLLYHILSLHHSIFNIGVKLYSLFRMN